MLPNVLQHIAHLKDLMSCASVSKGWRQNCLVVRPRTLSLKFGVNGDRRYIPSPQAQASACRKLTALKLGKNLESLQHVNLLAPCNCSPPVVAYLAVLTSTPLRTCRVSAPLDMRRVLRHMARSVQHVVLDCKIQHRVELKDFGVFKQLDTLELTARQNYACSLVMNDRLHALHTLSLVARSRCFGIDETTCSQLAACLPNLKFLALTDYAKSLALHAVLSLTSLVELDLELRAANSEARAPVVLTVPSLSNLRRLAISGPHGLVTLVVNKSGLQIKATGVRVIQSTVTS